MEQPPAIEQPPAPEPDRNPTSWLMIVVVVLILAGFVLTAFYGVRVLRSYRMLHRTPLRPGVTDVSLVRGWMTIPYLARAYRVPEEVLWRGLGIPPEHNRFKSLRGLDREYAGGKPGVVLERVKGLIQEYESQHPAPATPTPRPPVVSRGIGQPHHPAPALFHAAGEPGRLCSRSVPVSRSGAGWGGMRFARLYLLAL